MALIVGELAGVLKLDTNPFERGLDRAMSNAERSAGKKMEKLGGDLTKKLSLPLAAAGTAAAKMSVDFDTSMSRIVGLVGVAADEVDEMRAGVLQLSGETAKGPQELADALFTVTSAGFRGSEAMAVLESAAKASAAGMGETRTIAEALTGAVNAYGPEVLDANRATEILVATARAGNFETSQLAGSLGRVTPFAKQAGASLDDVGGAVALLTRVNNNATESITQITALMRAFVVPTAEAQTILGDLGMTAEDVRKSIGEQGLVATLQMLDQKLGGNREQLGKLLGSSEAASAAFQILEADAATIEGTFGAVADSAGIVDEAFGAAADTAGFKMKQALAELQVAAISAGDVIVPFAASVVSGIGSVAEAFTSMPEAAQYVVIALAAIMTATGPVLSVAGKVATNWKRISSAFETAALRAMYLRGNLVALGTGMVGVGAIVVAAGALWADYQKTKAEAAAIEAEYTRLLSEQSGEIDRNVAAHAGRELLAGGLGEALRNAGADVDVLTDAVMNNSEALTKLNDLNGFVINGVDGLKEALEITGLAGSDLGDELVRLYETGGLTANQMTDLTDRLNDQAEGYIVGTREAKNKAAADEAAGTAADEAVPPTEDLMAALEGNATAAESASEELQGYADRLAAVFDPLFGARDAMQKLQEAQQAVTDAHAANSDAIDDNNVSQEEMQRLNQTAVAAAMDYQTALLNLKAAVERGDVSISDSIATLDLWVEQGLITRQQADEAAWSIGVLGAKADEVDGKNVVVTAEADTARAELALAALTRSRNARIQVQLDNPYTNVPGVQVRDAGGPILGPKGSPQMVLGHAGEIVLPTHRMGLGEALRQTLGIGTAPATGPTEARGRTLIERMEVYPQEPARPWLDEGLWRAARAL